MEEEVENAPENITKLVINNQTKTELQKSPPIKTYSKKSPDSGNSCETKSRYGRERKHNTSDDFLSTDHRLGQYLKQETVKEAYFKKSTTKKVIRETSEICLSPTKRKRGRPRKSLPDFKDFESNESVDKDFLNKTMPAMDLTTDYQAPAPTSTETLPLPIELKGVKGESDQEEDVEDADWNCGDLAWAAVPSYPYWPCAITRDPVDRKYVKQAYIGRSSKPQVLYHVRFFGDNGRRSWVKSVNLMSFTGLDDYQNMVEEMCTPELKRTDLRMYKMFTIATGQRKTWQAAVSEAESLLASPRSERILYFETLYPAQEQSANSDIKDLLIDPSVDNRKRKIVEPSMIIKPYVDKKIKIDCNRYSIDIETLALQAAPITPRAIFVKKTNSYPTSNKLPHKKRSYVKRSEKWLQCKNKTMTGIVAGMKPHVRLSDSPTASNTNDKTILNISNDIKDDGEDDFAVPPAAELPLAPSVNAIQSLANEVNIGTPMEYETFDDDKVKSIIENSNLEITDTSMCDLSSYEDTDNSNYGVSLVNKSRTGSTNRNLVRTPNSPASENISKSVSSTTKQKKSEITTEDTPTKRKRGRPRKYPLDPNSPPIKSPLNNNKLSYSQKKESKLKEFATPSRSSKRPQKKSLQTLEDSEPELKLSKEKQPLSKSVIKKNQKPKGQDESLEIRKFGYKGSKVFKKFLELNFDKIVDERPDLSAKDVKKYIEDLWLRKTDSARQKFKSRLEAEATEDFSVDKTLPAKAELPLALPSTKGSSSNQSKKIPSLFQGIKLDRVCHICLKGENLIRCKGCVGYFHKDCGENRTREFKEEDDLDKSGKKKKIKKKGNLPAEDDKSLDESNFLLAEVKTEPKSPEKSHDSEKNILKEDVDASPKNDTINENEIIKVENDGSNNVTDKNDIDKTEKNTAECEPTCEGMNCPEVEKSSDATSDGVNVKTIQQEGESQNDSVPDGNQSNSAGNLSKTESNVRKQQNLDELICEKENVLPSDTGDNIGKNITDNVSSKISTDNIKIRNIDCSSVDALKPSPAHVSKSESVSSDDSVKSEDCKSESDKSDVQKASDCDSDSRKSFDKQSKKKGNVKKTSDSESENGKIKPNGSWKCLMCRQNIEDVCYICKKETTEEKYRCCISSCGLMYHLSCAEIWPQTHTIVNQKRRTVLTCPQHSCHTCISDNPKANMPKYSMDKLVKCLHCPTSYHHSNYCVPAGCEILSNSQIICSRHYDGPSKLHHVNAAWCFICSVGGSLICCDLCPNSFHVECLKIPSPEGSFICEDCETGRYPLYGEIIWVKLGAYRWWPARILFPSEIPVNIKQLPHRRGEFAIRFFGSHDHYWVNRGRVFLYHEGDGEVVANKSRVDRIFNQAMIEAREAFNAFTSERDEREAVSKSAIKPPKFIKLYKNVCLNNKLSGLLKPVEGYVANLTPCECTPTLKNPCGLNSDCINRLLMIECNPQVCPAKEKCCNQNFEKRLYPSVVPFMTDNRGWGLKTNEPIKEGDFIIEYVGEIIDETEYQKRLGEMEKKKNENYYFLTIDKDIMLDAGPKGNVARFMNHSCEPNCETQKWTVNGVTRVGLFALVDIPKDTELVFNYQLETIGNSQVACKCGAKTCSGFIGGAKSINKNQNGENSKKVDNDKKKAKENKRIKRSKSAVKPMSDFCFTCDLGGELLLCDAPNCPNGYHLSCLGLTKEPSGEWTCPVHQCSICNCPKVKRCALCINSYCSKHTVGNIIKHKIHGLVCSNHALSDASSDLDTDKRSSSSAPDGDQQIRKMKQQKIDENVTSISTSSDSPAGDTKLSTAADSVLLNGHASS